MNSKQKTRTVLLVLLLAVCVVGGVFGISYYKGEVSFPWDVTTASVDEEKATADAEKSQQKEANVEVKKEEPKETETQGSVKEDAAKVDKSVKENAIAKPDVIEKAQATEDTLTGNKLDYYGQLSVQDGALVGSEGQSARLVGVSSHGMSWFPEFASADSIKSLRDDWGINVFRLAMYTSDYDGYCVGSADNQEKLKEEIDDAVNAATENDMYIIIDWHTLNDANPNEYKSDAIQFFGEMVRKYKDNENVIYEICNEPNGDTTWADVKDYANEVIPVIRNVDEDAVILVGTPNYCSDLASVVDDPLDFDNIMYTFHFYAGTHKSSYRNELGDALDAGLPVFISECGFVAADGDGSVDTKEAAKWVDILDEYNLSTVVWNLSNKDEGSALISSECTKTADWVYDDLSAQGQYFIDYLSEQTIDSNKKSETEESEVTEDSEDTQDSQENSKSQNSKENKR
ncbi:MAG: glycoside hydrolase family 5 protein [Pseudobutyrivibrio sp.]|nr:glycoside hydrolase family 5 protein [Pseudobutyrivibrio sp.]